MKRKKSKKKEKEYDLDDFEEVEDIFNIPYKLKKKKLD